MEYNWALSICRGSVPGTPVNAEIIAHSPSGGNMSTEGTSWTHPIGLESADDPKSSMGPKSVGCQ